MLRISDEMQLIYAELPRPAVSPSVKHPDVFCDACLEAPGAVLEGPPPCLKGVRYKCLECDDLDLCAAHRLSTPAAHEATHTLVPWDTPHAAPIPAAPLLRLMHAAFAAYAPRPFLGVPRDPSHTTYEWVTYGAVWRRACAFAEGLRALTRGSTGTPFVGVVRLGTVVWHDQASALAAVAVSVGEWQKVPFFRSVSGGVLIFPKGTVGKNLDLRENGRTGTVKNGYFVPSPPPPIFVPFSWTTSRHNPHGFLTRHRFDREGVWKA